MTALSPVDPNAKINPASGAANGQDSPSLATGLFTHLLGSMGQEAVAKTDGNAAGIGRHGASPALAKRTSKSTAQTDPTQMAVAELSTRGTTKATVQAAEQDSKAPAAAKFAKEPAAQPRATTSGPRQTDSGNTPAEPKSVTPATHSGSNAKPVSGAVQANAAAASAATAAKANQARNAMQPLAAVSAAAARVIQVSPAGQSRAQFTPVSANVRAVTAQKVANQSTEKLASKAPQQTAPRDPEEDFAAQLGRGMSAIMRQSGGTLTLRLQPEALGELTIRMDLQPGKVAATFEVDSDQAQQLLNTHMSTLRSALEAKGLGVETLAVHVSDKPVQDAPVPMEIGSNHGGAGSPGGGTTGEGGGGAGTDRPLAQAAVGYSRSDEWLWPEAGAEGEDTGGAQVIRLALDAVA